MRTRVSLPIDTSEDILWEGLQKSWTELSKYSHVYFGRGSIENIVGFPTKASREGGFTFVEWIPLKPWRGEDPLARPGKIVAAARGRLKLFSERARLFPIGSILDRHGTEVCRIRVGSFELFFSDPADAKKNRS